MKFVSKKNNVFLSDGVVVKHVASEEAAAFEAENLKRLYDAGVVVPKVFSCDEAVLTMEFLQGETLPDILENIEQLQIDSSSHVDLSEGLEEIVLLEIRKATSAIIKWLSEFYNAVDSDVTGEIRGDVNGRNFLFDDALCMGVDFEEKVFGIKEQDIGRLRAFVTTYDPPGTQVKVEFARQILQEAVKELDVNEDEVKRQQDFELCAMQERRNRRREVHKSSP